MTRTLDITLGFALAVCWLEPPASWAAERAEVLAAVSSITKDEAKGFIDRLADDSFEGREGGSRGGRAAGNLLMKEFERHDLTPAGDGKTYFQQFNGSARNLLGLLPGSDPALAEQVIVVGAHYDHVGYGRATNSFGPTGYIHNGADDNASGVAGVLEVIDAMRRLPSPPRRTILFALWDSEEQGLLGSKHWLAYPTIDVGRVVTAVNLDMIGRLRAQRLEIFGTRTAPDLRRTISGANRDVGLEIDYSWLMKADSDHWPFYSRSIPSIMFHTGLHNDYHRPSDDAHLINAEGVASVSQLVLLTVLELADRDAIGKFREQSRREGPLAKLMIEQPIAAQGPRWGIPFDIQGDPPQFVLSGTSRGSPAEAAGLLAGDKLIEFQNRPITDEKRFRLELLAASGESTFTVKRPGQDTPLLIKITPAGSPIRVGVTWRFDEAEPGSVLLTQVVYGSAAHAAGLQVKDRIQAINGQHFAGQDEFAKLLTAAPSPIELEVERAGRLQTVRIEVVDLKP
jgi:hypothetical protein